MPTPFEHLASVNRLVHEPARLAILTALSACDKADFVFLVNVTGLTKGNLSSHSVEARAGRARRDRKAVRRQAAGDLRDAVRRGTRGAEGGTGGRFEQIRQGARALKPLKVT